MTAPHEYTPTPGPLPGEQWEPSNGTDGADFHEEWCSRCERDREMNGSPPLEGPDYGDGDWCPILGASFREGGVVEWREMPSGECVCIAFVPMGERIPEPRCTRTLELFQAGDGVTA